MRTRTYGSRCFCNKERDEIRGPCFLRSSTDGMEHLSNLDNASSQRNTYISSCLEMRLLVLYYVYLVSASVTGAMHAAVKWPFCPFPPH